MGQQPFDDGLGGYDAAPRAEPVPSQPPPPPPGDPRGAHAPPPYQGPPPAGAPPGVPVIPLLVTPIVGMPMRGPVYPPQPGQVLLGYEVVQPEVGCCMCDGLSAVGLISVILLILFFWPLAWVPCVMPECFDKYQRPVYGYPAPPMPPPGGFGYGPPPPPAGGYPTAQPAGYPPNSFETSAGTPSA